MTPDQKRALAQQMRRHYDWLEILTGMAGSPEQRRIVEAAERVIGHADGCQCLGCRLLMQTEWAVGRGERGLGRADPG